MGSTRKGMLNVLIAAGAKASDSEVDAAFALFSHAWRRF